MKRFLLFSSIVFLLSIFFDLNAQRVYSEEEISENVKIQRPRKKFKFNKKRFVKNREIKLIDTNAVYITVSQGDNDRAALYRFARFFSTGEMYYSFPYRTIPSDDEFNRFDYGMWNMYNLKRREIVLELYVRFTAHPFEYFFGWITSDSGIRIYKYKIGKGFSGAVNKTTFSFQKRHVKFDNFQVPWK